MSEFYGMVLSSYSLLGFKMFRNLEGYLPIDSFIHHGKSGFLPTLYVPGRDIVDHSRDGSQTLVGDHNNI